ncbi:MAG TPA: hypothetical protein PKA13_10660 [Geminicoccaceae bacterium]|nr:hypothetical protein [Geminicoccus sp.]HMU50227.1 hypothetical protein [Geminicoccaceae bacterium]
MAVLLTLMRELEEVIRLENGVLRDMKLGRVADLQKEKAALAEKYEVQLRALRSSPEVVASLPDGVRANLEQATRSFQEIVRANVRALGAARTVVEGIVRHIGESLATVRPSRTGYPGMAGMAAEGGPGRVIAVAFDRRI